MWWGGGEVCTGMDFHEENQWRCRMALLVLSEQCLWFSTENVWVVSTTPHGSTMPYHREEILIFGNTYVKFKAPLLTRLYHLLKYFIMISFTCPLSFFSRLSVGQVVDVRNMLYFFWCINQDKGYTVVNNRPPNTVNLKKKQKKRYFSISYFI